MDRGDKEEDKAMWFDRGKCHAPCFFLSQTLLCLFVATCLCLSVDNAQTEACYVTQMREMCG